MPRDTVYPKPLAGPEKGRIVSNKPYLSTPYFSTDKFLDFVFSMLKQCNLGVYVGREQGY